MISIAILGFGTVGGGVASVLCENADKIKKAVGDDVAVKYILDLREFPDSPWGGLVVHDIGVILNDPDVTLAVEAMGGSHPALEFSEAMMKAGKHVVTSNKEVVANFGVRLLKTAEENNVRYLYEASVGGGIPVIRTIRTALSCEKITEISGILNGTTNYIFTQMEETGVDYCTALDEAKALGYAEANPAADVDGIDAQRKICILAALATGRLIPTGDIYTETMRKVTSDDIGAAKRFWGAVKLIGSVKIEEDGVYICVFPAIVSFKNPLAHIKDVFNGIRVETNMTGEVMLYGKGAGRYPTAGAIVGDVTAILSGGEEKVTRDEWQPSDKNFVKAFDTYTCRHYLRLKAGNKPECECETLDGSPEGTVEYITPEMSERDFNALLTKLGGALISTLRIL